MELAKEEGGLGIRSLQDLNMAMIAKLVWKFLNDPNCPWGQLMKANYLKQSWTAEKPAVYSCDVEMQRDYA